jgi:hypothetical protein
MATRRREETEQRLIDHEVRLSEAREAGERFTAARESRRDARGRQSDRLWYRRELIAMLRAAQTEDELHELGLSDAVVREARLGDSLAEAWASFRLWQFSPPPRDGDRPS